MPREEDDEQHVPSIAERTMALVDYTRDALDSTARGDAFGTLLVGNATKAADQFEDLLRDVLEQYLLPREVIFDAL